MGPHRIATREEWLAERKALLAKEKELTRARDAARGGAPRAALGAGREGLRLRRPRRAGERSPTCSTAAASSSSTTSCSAPTGRRAASAARSWPTTSTARASTSSSTTSRFVAVSRAPLRQDRAPSASAWAGGSAGCPSPAATSTATSTSPSRPSEKADGKVYYNFGMIGDPGTTSCRASASSTRTRRARSSTPTRPTPAGGELMLGAYAYLDLMPKGRNEHVRGNLGDWVRHHDRYGAGRPRGPDGPLPGRARGRVPGLSPGGRLTASPLVALRLERRAYRTGRCPGRAGARQGWERARRQSPTSSFACRLCRASAISRRSRQRWRSARPRSCAAGGRARRPRSRPAPGPTSPAAAAAEARTSS